MNNRRFIIICPALVQKVANEAVEGIGGPGVFTVAVSADENDLAPSHYWCNWAMSPETWDACQEAWEKAGVWDLLKVTELDSYDPALATPTPDEVLAGENLTRWEEKTG